IGSLLHDFVENRRRVELGREQLAGPRQLLSERARGALGLEELAALERAPCRVREVAREFEVLLRENALLLEEDDDEAAGFVARRLDRHREQRAIAVGCGSPMPAPRQPLVLGERRRGDHSSLNRGPCKWAVAFLDALLEHGD